MRKQDLLIRIFYGERVCGGSMMMRDKHERKKNEREERGCEHSLIHEAFVCFGRVSSLYTPPYSIAHDCVLFVVNEQLVADTGRSWVFGPVPAAKAEGKNANFLHEPNPLAQSTIVER